MPDTNQNPDLIIRTPQELADAVAAETQLEILSAHAQGASTNESDLRLAEPAQRRPAIHHQPGRVTRRQ